MIGRFISTLALVSALIAAEPQPVRVAVMVDQTGSTLTTGVPVLQESDFNDLIDLLLRNGGEIGVGAIRDRSNRPLLRCRIEQKPIRHAQAPPEKMNVFLRQRLMRTYLADKSKEDALEAQWQEESQKRIDAFRKQLRMLLNAPLAGRTDINGAITRADLFLAEPDDGWREQTRRFVLFHSDGLDNVRAHATPFTSGAAVLLVNGSASVGALKTLNPTSYENFEAAVRYIVSRSKEE